MSWAPVIAAGISAGSDILGGILGGSSAKKQAKKAAKFAKKQFEYMKYLNANRIRLTVDDAKAAGIHPLAALGASGAGGFAAPVPQYPESGGGFGWGDAVGSGLSALGDVFDAYSQMGESTKDPRSRGRAPGRPTPPPAPTLMERSALDLNKANIRMLDAQALEATTRTRLMEAKANAQGATTGRSLTLDSGGNVLTNSIFPDIAVIPGRASAQQVEDYAGDMPGWLYGGANLLEGILNGPGWTRARRGWNRLLDQPRRGAAPPVQNYRGRYYIP